MAITIGDMLGGIGAAFGGTAQQYAQGLRCVVASCTG